jgi:hypothetical protein
MRLDLSNGAAAQLLETDGTRVVLGATEPAPPGSTLLATAEIDLGRLSIKVKACRRIPGGAFRIEGRLLDLSRTQREKLLASR